jgi:hypothetical protein
MPAVLRRLFDDGGDVAVKILQRSHVRRALRNMPNWQRAAG